MSQTLQAALLASLEEDAAPATKAKPKKKGKRSKAAAAAASLQTTVSRDASAAAAALEERQAMRSPSLLPCGAANAEVSGASVAEAGNAGCPLHRVPAGSLIGRECSLLASSTSEPEVGRGGDPAGGPAYGWVQVVKASAPRRCAGTLRAYPFPHTVGGRQASSSVASEDGQHISFSDILTLAGRKHLRHSSCLTTARHPMPCPHADHAYPVAAYPAVAQRSDSL